MKVAKSLVLGGRLINADEVTNRYTAYKDLLLVCPECYKTVYWKEATGFSSGRHFAHSARATHGEECSQRVNIQGDSYLESNADDKGQRLKIFQEHLLSIINTFDSRPKSIISEFQNKFKAKSSDLSDRVYNLFLGQNCLHGFEHFTRVEDNPKIALEVILYLRQNHSVLRKVIELGIDWFSAGTDCLRFQKVSGRTIISAHLNEIILRYILYIIASINWNKHVKLKHGIGISVKHFAVPEGETISTLSYEDRLDNTLASRANKSAHPIISKASIAEIHKSDRHNRYDTSLKVENNNRYGKYIIDCRENGTKYMTRQDWLIANPTK